MNREEFLEAIRKAREPWDLLVIGGGATGLGTAVDACSRGYRTVLLEQHDFAKSTSSRSTKLVHGGVRYLRQGNISLVRDALRERGRLFENAPHLVHRQAFVIPVYHWWEKPFYGIGLKLYDQLAGDLGLGRSRLLSRSETLERLPTLQPAGLRGGVCYYDGQFDDARLAVNLAQTIGDLGGIALNYVKVVGLQKSHGKISGVVARDEETGEEIRVSARAVINATGVFCDAVRNMDEAGVQAVTAPSQGAHVVLPESFLKGETALMVPRTPDGRVMFAIPWHGRTLVGTTDCPVSEVTLEPRPMEQEIEFILDNAAKYLSARPGRGDVLSMFAGLRPLVRSSGDASDTAALSRDHTVLVSGSGLVTVVGGKWTTYRKMAEDTVNEAETVAGFTRRPCGTVELKVHGWTREKTSRQDLKVYGEDADSMAKLDKLQPALAELIHPELPYRGSTIVQAVRKEMARTVEDVLARRTRALVLDARASLEAAPAVARVMAGELGRDGAWEQRQVSDYAAVAAGYLL